MSSQDIESRVAVAFPKSIPLSVNFIQSYADFPRVKSHAEFLIPFLSDDPRIPPSHFNFTIGVIDLAQERRKVIPLV